MVKMIDVYLTKGEYKKGISAIERSIISVEVVEERSKSFLVKLADGNIISRKKSNQVVAKE